MKGVRRGNRFWSNIGLCLVTAARPFSCVSIRPCPVPLFGKRLKRLAYRQEKHGPWLLGIDWCHIHDNEKVCAENGAEIVPAQYVKVSTGMAGVIPAWRLLSLLNCDELKAQ